MAASTTPVASPESETVTLDQVQPDTPWVVQLANDDVNVILYVVTVLQRVLSCDLAAAERLAMIVHTEGRGTVFTGTLTECEPIAQQLTSAQLWASVSKAGA